jgi:hypothetical protein
MHGGAMHIRSELGKGTLVVVRLPLEAQINLVREKRDVPSPPLADFQATLV